MYAGIGLPEKGDPGVIGAGELSEAKLSRLEGEEHGLPFDEVGELLLAWPQI